MIGKQPSKIGMPKLKRCSAEKEEISGGNDVGNSRIAAVDSKKLSNQMYTVPIVQIEGKDINLSSYCRKIDMSLVNSKVNSIVEEVPENKPPLLKSSLGRRKVLPTKFKDSILHPWKKEKLESGDDLEGCLADNDECAQDVSRNKNSQNKKSKREQPSVSRDDDIYLVKKKPRIERKLDFSLKNIILEPNYSSPSSVTSVDAAVSSVSTGVESGGKTSAYAGTRKTVKEKVTAKKADFYEPADFVMGDIVWAKCGKNFPAWPAVVIDPLLQAPETVLRACIPGTLCVMFYGFSRTGLRVNYSEFVLMHDYIHSGNLYKCYEQLQLVISATAIFAVAMGFECLGLKWDGMGTYEKLYAIAMLEIAAFFSPLL